MTEWKWVPGYKNHYQASTTGEIKSFKRGKERIMKPFIMGQGWAINFNLNGKKAFYVHRVIYETFREKIQDGFVVDHINGDINDNSIGNLRSCLPEDNTKNRRKRKMGSSQYKGVSRLRRISSSESELNK